MFVSQNGTYTIGGPCDPSRLGRSPSYPGDRLCIPEKADDSGTYNQKVRCNWAQDTTKPGNDSYDKLVQNPYAYDSAVVRHLCHGYLWQNYSTLQLTFQRCMAKTYSRLTC